MGKTKQEREQELLNTLNRLKEYDNSFNKVILGIDEVGRGPLAGPVVVAGVIMKKESNILGVRDSKKISEKKRVEFYDKIINDCLFYDIQIIDSKKIDEVNILNATKIGMQNIINNLEKNADIILVDAVSNLNSSKEQLGIIKGDDTSYSIACASIIAKVSRDNLMDVYDISNPEYNFKKNKGYGTKEHYEAIKKNGLLEIHRRSFLKNLDEH